MRRPKACRECRYIVEEGDVCPNCGSKNLTSFWKGMVIVIDPEKSEIAKKLGIKRPGKYALQLGR